jgi:alpha-mannosidase
VSATLRVAAGGAPAHTTRVTVYAGLDRVDVEDRITQNFGNAVGYQFDLGLTGFTVRHEEVGMVARAARIRDGGDYANQNARTDHLTFNHFVDLSESGFGVTISNGDSGFFRLGASTQDVLDTSRASLVAVVGMQSEGPDLGFPNQGGDASFLNRYALATHGAYDAASAMRTALEHQNPLVARAVTGGSTAPMPLRYGLLHADDPDVVVWAVKPAEEGIDRGVIVRAWNFADRARPVAINPHGGSTLSSAMRTTHIEGDLTPATVRDGCLFDTLERQQMQTWRLMLTGVNTTGNVLTPGLDAGVSDAGGGMALQRAPSTEPTGCAAGPRGASGQWPGWSVAALLLAFRAAGRRRTR